MGEDVVGSGSLTSIGLDVGIRTGEVVGCCVIGDCVGILLGLADGFVVGLAVLGLDVGGNVAHIPKLVLSVLTNSPPEATTCVPSYTTYDPEP